MPKTRKNLLKQARLYRLFAIVFLFTGMFIFILLYLRNVDGRLWQALTSPQTIMVVLFPFIPAALLSWLAKSSEKKYFSQPATKTISKIS